MKQGEEGEAITLGSGVGEGDNDGVDGEGKEVGRLVNVGSTVCKVEECKVVVCSEHAKGNVFS